MTSREGELGFLLSGVFRDDESVGGSDMAGSDDEGDSSLCLLLIAQNW